MLSFRKKILITYFAVFIVFIALIFPFATNGVHRIVVKAMQDRATELIEKIQTAPNNDELIKRLRQQRFMIFFRVSIISDDRKVLYDSHVKRVLGPKFNQEYVVYHPEVEQAFKEGSGYNADYSMLLGGQKFAYMAKTFDFHGKTYVMRTAFPFRYVVELSEDFKIGFIALLTLILLLFTIMTWFVINYLSKPIQQIITAITPYQEGEVNALPEIRLSSVSPSDDFSKLANTLNSMSSKIQNHINTLTMERNQKEAILESLIEGVIAIDPAMIVTYANNMALKFLEIEEKTIIGQNFSLTHQPKFYALLADCQKENKALTDTIQIKKDGGTIYLDIIAAPIRGNKGAILVMQDQTAHHRILEMRKDFIANASHELKTPITIIRGFAETLHDNPDLPKETTTEITDKIVRNCIRMTSLIKDLLTLADIENLPSSRVSECNLVNIFEKCRERTLQMYPNAIITIDKNFEGESCITGVPELLDLAFTNLIENAAKYSNQPADIHIAIEDQANFAKICIIDKGIGIPQADLTFIFERFYTVNKAHSRKLGGTGLGLAIVQSIIEKHFGKISVKSTIDQGTTFTILLPKHLENLI